MSTEPTTAERAGYALVATLARMDLPWPEGAPVRNADDLLGALVARSDARGRYFANPGLLRRLFWWQQTKSSTVATWLTELVARGEVTVAPLGRSVYSNDPVAIVSLVRRHRFPRFAARSPISAEVRQRVFERDEFCCVRCGSTEGLSLDHIYPWSLGGTDDPDNLQTLCRPCNSRKGARV